MKQGCKRDVFCSRDVQMMSDETGIYIVQGMVFEAGINEGWFLIRDIDGMVFEPGI